MAAGDALIDIQVLGVPMLERKLQELEHKAGVSVVRKALRKSAVRTKKRIVENLSGLKVQVHEGILRTAFSRTKIKSRTRKGFTRVGPVLPDSAALGINRTKDEGNYYPIAIEFGHKQQGGGWVPPHPFLRPAVDEHTAEEYARIGKDIGTEIERVA